MGLLAVFETKSRVDFELQSFCMHIRTLGLIPSFEERRETVHLEKAANNGRGKSKFATAGPKNCKDTRTRGTVEAIAQRGV
jgi:hypothetical protein